jgi:hypothetical protein
MHDDSQRTAQNPSQTVGAGAGRAAQTGEGAGSAPTEPGKYDDDGALAQQTPGLDAEEIRRDAGPDWAPGTKGDLEADTSPAGGSGASPDPGAQSTSER